MPVAHIHVRRGRTPQQNLGLLQGIHSALVDAFAIPDADRTQVLHEHSEENFEIPPAKSNAYTLIEITAFRGRSEEAKRRLYRTIVQNLETAGIATSDVLIVLHEPPLENWGIRGVPASEVDLGYRLDV